IPPQHVNIFTQQKFATLSDYSLLVQQLSIKDFLSPNFGCIHLHKTGQNFTQAHCFISQLWATYLS
ncbi:unnamed protein product, partial [Allacma fusca]